VLLYEPLVSGFGANCLAFGDADTTSPISIVLERLIHVLSAHKALFTPLISPLVSVQI